uniref:Tripartite motif containing 59 n=1 Tax=Hucho hucho TaxID=62062 RepID=A0A4W5PB66_9TELE
MPYFRLFFTMPAPISYIEHRGTNSPSERSIPRLFYVTMPALLLLEMRPAHVAGSSNVNNTCNAEVPLFTIGKHRLNDALNCKERNKPGMQSLIVPSPHLTMHNLEEDLTCSVCYSRFTDPRVLPCSHTFCKSCLDKVFQVSAIYSIWRPLQLPLKGCYALPINVSLRAIIKFQKDSHPRPPSCPEHHRQPLNVYCVQDRQLICGFCLTVGQHQGHSIDDMHAAFIRERQAPAHLLARLSDHRRAEVCELGEQLEQASCEGLVRQDRQAVEQYFQGLELARKKEAFMGALDTASVEVSLAYDPLIQKLKKLQVCELGEQLEQKASCEGLVRQDRQAVEQYFHGLELVLARKKEAFMGALDTASVEVSLAYDPLIRRLELQEQLDLLSLGSAVEDEDSPLVFLEKFYLFREVEALVNPPLPKVISLSITLVLLSTIEGLVEEPVPRFFCCAKPTILVKVLRTEAGSHPGGWVNDLLLQLQPTLPVVLLLLLAAVWVNPVGGASLGFSKRSQMLHGLSSKLTASLWETAGFLYAQTVEVQLFLLHTGGEHLPAAGILQDPQLMTERHMGLHFRKDPSTW